MRLADDRSAGLRCGGPRKPDTGGQGAAPSRGGARRSQPRGKPEGPDRVSGPSFADPTADPGGMPVGAALRAYEKLHRAVHPAAHREAPGAGVRRPGARPRTRPGARGFNGMMRASGIPWSAPRASVSSDSIRISPTHPRALCAVPSPGRRARRRANSPRQLLVGVVAAGIAECLQIQQ
jgi:hypothetical protein